MKKLAALLMILSLGLFTAVGCSSESTPAAKDKAPAAGAKAGADKKATPETKPAEKPATPPAEKK